MNFSYLKQGKKLFSLFNHKAKFLQFVDYVPFSLRKETQAVSLLV